MRLSAVALLFAFGFAALPAGAQVIAPGLDNDLNIQFDRAFDNITNPFLSDSIKLNYQITLLEKMTQRQAELTKISEAFAALGIPYSEPAPSYTLCGQLPPNVPCLRHYPDLYQSLVNERRQHYAKVELENAISSGVVSEQVAALDPKLAERAKKEREAAEQRAKEARLAREAEERKNRYRWSDVSCLSGDCRGVVTGAGTFRATVRKGMRLPDGSLVESIDRSGITLLIDGDRIALRPDPKESGNTQTSRLNVVDDRTIRIVNASSETIVEAPPISIEAQPVSGGAGAAAAGATPTAQTLPPEMMPPSMAGGAGGGNASVTANGESAGPGGVTMVEPTLGPSGLF